MAERPESHNPDQARSQLLRNVIPQDKLRQLSQPSDVQGLLQLGYHVGCMLASTLLIHWALANDTGTIAVWSAMTLHGYFLSFLFMGLHECVHHTAFSSRWLNSVTGWWYGLLCGRLPRYYTFFHFPHHRYTGDLRNDPELMDTLVDPNIASLSSYFIYLTGLPFWIGKIETAFR